MRMRSLNIKRAFVRKKYFKLVFVYFLIPIATMLVAAFLIYNRFQSIYQNEIRQSYLTNLSTLADDVDNTLNELQNTTILLSSDANLYELFYTEKPLVSSDSVLLKNMMDTLIKFKSTKSLIDSVFMLHKYSDTVLDPSGTSNVATFFNRGYQYSRYNADYWMNLRIRNNFYQILEPSMVTTTGINSGNTQRQVIPFVTSNIETFRSKNLFVINISVQELSDKLNKYNLMLGSNLCILGEDGAVYASTDKELSHELESNKMLSATLLSGSEISTGTFAGDKALFITHRTKNAKFNDFVFCAVIPVREFNQRLAGIKQLTFTIMLLAVLMSTFLAYRMSRKIYSPIRNLVSMFSTDHGSAGADDNEMTYLNSQIGKLLSAQDDLQKNLSAVLPLASEQYLLNLMQNSNLSADMLPQDDVIRGHVRFPHVAFVVTLFDMNFTNLYSQNFSHEDHLAITKGISALIAETLSDTYHMTILNVNRNRLAILLNVSPETDIDELRLQLSAMVRYFSNDMELLQLQVGIGLLHEGVSGMNRSYTEALRALSMLSPLSHERVQVFSERIQQQAFHYSIHDENKLFNFFMGVSRKDALDHLTALVDKLYATVPSDEAILKFYQDVFKTLRRVCVSKKIQMPGGPDAIPEDPQALELLSPGDMHQLTLRLAEHILSLNQSGTRIDLRQILDYIQSNYTDDIYLEVIARNFNTSEAYLSRLFKESLGIGFHDYLISVRIARAKLLLSDTDKSVTSIGELVGFNTHSTFFRVFKKVEGISPTQYRDNFRNSAH